MIILDKKTTFKLPYATFIEANTAKYKFIKKIYKGIWGHNITSKKGMY